MCKILLTGSGGFIGKNLKAYLKDRYILLTPRSYELDLTDENAVKQYFAENDIDFVIHCATVGGARGIPDKENTVEENLAMVNNILNCKKQNVRVILFGSGAMYDKNRDLHKVKENTIGEYIPSDLYGKSKLSIAEIVKQRKDVLCLNIFACYGYDEKESRFPSYAIRQNILKEPIVINQNVVFDYLFIEDMNKIVEYFINHKPKDNIINITPTKSVSLVEIAELVNQISEYKSEIIIKNKNLNYEYTGDNSLLTENYQDIEFTDLKTGLTNLYNYIYARMRTGACV